ncbi:MAG TPA: quinone-dependent dihydroorotate dehydrogenase [Patescibacteria group bacterium]|nr:quinone-dependent dihydroorotate dehydrogenase [Patescibacteria group bacterium]
MIRTVSQFSSWGFKRIVKPILFLFPPDGIHKALVSTGQVLGYIPPARWIFLLFWRYKNDPKLAQTVNGIYFVNPVGLSAGFDKNFQLLRVTPSLGFGFEEAGSLTLKASPGNPRPHYHRLKKTGSILVNAGLNNHGVDVLAARLKDYQHIRRQWMPIDISVAKTNSPDTCTDESGVKDYLSSLKKIKKMGIGEQITINISCPNAYGGEPFTTPERLQMLLKEIDNLKLDKPIYIKMPSDKKWPEFKQLLDVVLKHKIAGIKLTNLAKDRKNAKLLDKVSDDIPGSMSGRPTYAISNELISKTYDYCGDKLTIVGVGGIFSAKEAYEKIKRGATLVELATGMIFEGPMVIGQINEGLVDLMQKDGYSHISQAIGAYHRKR